MPRISKVYTRTGDDGETGLGNNQRISKASLLMEAIGTIDELNAFIGLADSFVRQENLENFDLSETLIEIQQRLFDIGGALSVPNSDFNLAVEKTLEEAIPVLESVCDRYNAQLPPLKNFVLPRGSHAVCFTHAARTICRRAERALIRIDGKQRDTFKKRYLNRLSDFLFVAARMLGNIKDEVIWEQEK